MPIPPLFQLNKEPMKLNRRTFFGTASIPFTGTTQQAGSFPGAKAERALFPGPVQGAVVGVNPPGFAWWRAKGAKHYILSIFDHGGRTAYRSKELADPVHLPARLLPPGDYTWDVEALDLNGTVIAKRGTWRFTVPAGIPELPWVEPKEILARLPSEHPRYVFWKADLPEIRRTLQSTRRADWLKVKTQAEKAFQIPLPEPPKYHTFQDPNQIRMGYVFYFREFRRRLDWVLTPLSIAYLFTGEERYGLRAKEILLTVEPWGVEGPMSLLARWGDEPGLSMARHGHRAYDFLYPLFDSGERERLKNLTIARGRQILERLRKADYLATPAESHNGRLIAYLAEYAMVLKTEAPDAAEWLDYSLRGLTSFYPHWGDADGGWAEGVSYALAYNDIYLAALESLRRAGFDLYRRPFFQSVRRFFLYCTSPIGEMKPFGDGSENGGPGESGAALLTHHARRFQDPLCLWWARQAAPDGGVDPLISLITEDNLKPQPPSALPLAALFRGIGWGALHSALDDPRKDTFFLFKSSPFGSVSHSHADQNSFIIMKGGRALAIPSGYYGPAYSMPHHAEWTRQTKANNSVLVNGEGQVVRSEAAQGRIEVFRHQQALTYLCGDAAAAYGGKMKRFLRHVLFLRPGVFIILDELAAAEPAQFQWLLHAFERMTVDPSSGTVLSRRQEASLTVRLACEHGLILTQTDQFDTPFNQGNPPEYQKEVANQWHFRASTERTALETRIAALLVVRDQLEELQTEWKQHRGWLGLGIKTGQGSGEAWVQIQPGAEAPAGIRCRLLFARWTPPDGSVETLAV